MPIIRFFPILILSLLSTIGLQAQFLDYGSDPARYKWNQVKLPHYNLIYPAGTDSMAYRYALYLENAYPHVQKTLGEPMKKTFPVILHPGSMQSNGLVSWAPRRMELITTPSAKQDAQQWDKHLVLHESRHIIQMGKVMHGIFRPLYYLIGEQAAGVAAFFLPTWFLEGDGVATETAMSNAGRGRLPEFNMPYRAQMMTDGRIFSFDRLQLGSYKEYTGDYYALGYDMTAYARYRYGGDIWKKTTSRYVAVPFLFSNAFKHNTGIDIDKLYKETFSFLGQGWQQMDTAVVTPRYLSPQAKSYTSYRYPQMLDDATVVAVKSGLKDINSLVQFVNGKERRLGYIGNINSRMVRQGNRLYWTEIVPGLRWAHENYSVLKQYDLIDGRTTILTPRQRYLSPAIKPDGQTAAVSRFTPAGRNELVLVNLEDGKEIATFAVPDNAFIKELTFADGDAVVAVAVNGTGITLLQLHTDTGQWSELLATTSANIASPVWHDGNLFFQSGANGTNNIYRLAPSDTMARRLTSARFGAFDPTFTPDNRLFYSDYQAKGYRIASLAADSLLDVRTDIGRPYRFPLAETIAVQEQFNLDSARLDSVDFNPRPYNKGLHTLKIHSWAPFYYDVTEAMNTGADDLTTLVKPGAMILSQNSLNTAIMQAGWYYRKGYHHGKLSFSYMGWFPVLDLSVDYGNKAFDMSWVKDKEGYESLQGNYTGRNLVEAEARVYLPFNLTKNHYIRGIQPSLTYYFTNNRYQRHGGQAYGNFQYVLPEVRIYNYRQMARRDILPRRGYQLRLQMLNSPFNTENFGNLYAARLTTYWPGILPNNSLMLRLGYQIQNLDDKALYLPKRLLEDTRGYDFLYQTHQQWGFKADYAFSIISPDLSLGEFVYIRRLRANLFYDFTCNQARKTGGWTVQSSYGTDLVFDWNILRMTYPLTTGVRLIQPIDYGRFQAEMLFSISF